MVWINILPENVYNMANNWEGRGGVGDRTSAEDKNANKKLKKEEK
jgi:hypothetical protein